MNHFLSFEGLSGDDVAHLLKHAHQLKKEWKQARAHKENLSGTVLAMIFESHSTRTRISFEVAMAHLGGYAINLKADELQLARGESLADSARVISGYCDGVMVRTKHHSTLQELARHATIPIINGLSDQGHPCQVLADLMTIEERYGSLAGLTLAWFGDLNNVFLSLAEASKLCGYTLRAATDQASIDACAPLLERYGVVAAPSPQEIAAGASVFMTDVWVSMHHSEAEQKSRKEKIFPLLCYDRATCAWR